jgi:hypothetical protein
LEIFDDFQTIPLADYFKLGGKRSGDNLRGDYQYTDPGEDTEEEMDVGV